MIACWFALTDQKRIGYKKYLKRISSIVENENACCVEALSKLDQFNLPNTRDSLLKLISDFYLKYEKPNR